MNYLDWLRKTIADVGIENERNKLVRVAHEMEALRRDAQDRKHAAARNDTDRAAWAGRAGELDRLGRYARRLQETTAHHDTGHVGWAR